MSNNIQYKLTNTTRWPGAKMGKHKQGFTLHINKKAIQYNQHMVVNEISEGIESLQRKKFLKIEPIENRHLLVKKQIEQTQLENDLAKAELEKALKKERKLVEQANNESLLKEMEEISRAEQESTPASSVDKESLKKAVRDELPQNTARVVGEDESMDPLSDVEEAINPDGKENFVVQAGYNRKNKNKNKN